MEKKMKAVYMTKEREGKKNIWTQVGVAFVNNDESINVFLDAFPKDGKLHIRDIQPKGE